MDIATLVGAVSGVTLVMVAILLGGGATIFFNVPSLMITVGGTVAATLINFPLRNVLGVFAVAKKTLMYRLPSSTEEIGRIVEYARVARRDGLLALENRVDEIDDPFLTKGIQLIIDGTPPETMRDMLTTEVEFLQTRHATGKKILEAMGGYAPAFGMIGTLIGLVQMLRQLESPDQIGIGMSTALLTTFYGAFMANLVFLPLAGKLDTRSKEEVLVRQTMIEGIISIQSGDNPRLIEEKLKSFIAPNLRDAAAQMASGSQREKGD